jgi:transcription elongation factor Elf1
MPPAKKLTELQRPRRRLRERFIGDVSCPLCFHGANARPAIRVIAWRKQSTRLECPNCGLRFSIDLENWVASMRRLIDASDTAEKGYVVVEPPHGPMDEKMLMRHNAEFIDDARLVGPQPAPRMKFVHTTDEEQEWTAGDGLESYRLCMGPQNEEPCNRPVVANGLCSKHYQRWRRRRKGNAA